MNATAKDVFDILKASTTIKELPLNSSPDTSLRELGVDSLDAMQFILALQEKYGIEVPDADVDELATVAKVVQYLNRRMAE